MIKKIFSTVVIAVSVLIIALSLFVLAKAVMTRSGEAPQILGYSAFRVLTDSMAPGIKKDDMILVKALAPDKVKEGDIISFFSADPELHDNVNTHRVVSVEETEGKYVFTTKGDANIIADKYTVDDSRLIGVVVGISSVLGHISRLAANPIVFVLCIILPLLAILIGNMVKTIRLASQSVREEELELSRLMEEKRKKAAEEDR